MKYWHVVGHQICETRAYCARKEVEESGENANQTSEVKCYS